MVYSWKRSSYCYKDA
ncbi:BnaA06g36390D [Brassica napus]|uniref:BnaA06g36390D protein n=1 Tax=Brassica napus TaxID=3708 RepID=A0A078GB56_BRANA|nr:BnaA06g36390D [Brassica napus]